MFERLLNLFGVSLRDRVLRDIAKIDEKES